MKRLLLVAVIAAVIYIGFTQITKEKHPETVEIGQLTPAFQLTTLTDEILNSKQVPSEGVVLNFWATYCPPCVKEMPLLEQQYIEGVEVWGVNAGESKFFINKFLKQTNVSFPILLDNEQLVSSAFEVMALPTTYFIDGQGVVQKKISGELTEQSLAEGLALLKKE